MVGIELDAYWVEYYRHPKFAGKRYRLPCFKFVTVSAVFLLIDSFEFQIRHNHGNSTLQIFLRRNTLRFKYCIFEG